MGLFDWSEEKVEKVYREGTAAFEEKNYAAALKLLTKAAERGHAGAQFHLGRMYSAGMGAAQDKAEALRWYEKSAEQGVAQAQHSLGDCCSSGAGTEKDPQKALQWYLKAARQGLSGAQYDCGLCYQEGRGVEKDEDKALEWYQKAASQRHRGAESKIKAIQARREAEAQVRPYLDRGMEAFKEERYQDALPDLRKAADLGDAEAQYRCALMYLQGMGVERNGKEGIDWLIKAAKQGHEQARAASGKMFAKNGLAAYNAEDYQKAIPLLEKAAMLGNAEAQNLLGLCYGAGKGAEKDCTKALHWYLKAAEQGYTSAQYNCGLYYREGYGTEKDEDKAFEWYQKAAAQGHEKAKKEAEKIQTRREKEKKEDEISTMIALGIAAYGTGKFDVALRAYLKAAEQGHVLAQFQCGLMYYYGEGTAVNKEKALYWTEKAAEQGDTAAQLLCGMMYNDGEGTAINKEKALYLIEKAAEQGVAEAQFQCGKLYRRGDGTAVNMAKALYWFEKAAEQGVAWAQLGSGAMYYLGEGTAKNVSKARYWLQKAAQSDEKEAAAKARDILREL